MSLEAASHGFGFALESSLLSQDYIRQGRLVPVFEEQRSSAVSAHHLVFPRPNANLPRVARFLAWMQEQLGHNLNYE